MEDLAARLFVNYNRALFIFKFFAFIGLIFRGRRVVIERRFATMDYYERVQKHSQDPNYSLLHVVALRNMLLAMNETILWLHGKDKSPYLELYQAYRKSYPQLKLD